MATTKTILAIIPCYNEAHSLPTLLSNLLQLQLPGYALSIAVVNDASTDHTATIAGQFPVALLDLPVNLGIGGAMQTGFRYAQNNDFDLALQVDGDGQHPPSEISKLLRCYENTNAHIVIGSRFLEKQGFQSSFTRRMGIRYFHLLNRVFTGNTIYDSTSGFRLFNKKAIKKAAACYPDDYPEPESLVLFARSGFTITETPVLMQERMGGKSSIRYFATAYYFIKVTIAMFFSYIRYY